jgi:hypothetical protein
MDPDGPLLGGFERLGMKLGEGVIDVLKTIKPLFSCLPASLPAYLPACLPPCLPAGDKERRR